MLLDNLVATVRHDRHRPRPRTGTSIGDKRCHSRQSWNTARWRYGW